MDSLSIGIGLIISLAVGFYLLIKLQDKKTQH